MRADSINREKFAALAKDIAIQVQRVDTSSAKSSEKVHWIGYADVLAIHLHTGLILCNLKGMQVKRFRAADSAGKWVDSSQKQAFEKIAGTDTYRVKPRRDSKDDAYYADYVLRCPEFRALICQAVFAHPQISAALTQLEASAASASPSVPTSVPTQQAPSADAATLLTLLQGNGGLMGQLQALLAQQGTPQQGTAPQEAPQQEAPVSCGDAELDALLNDPAFN